jgi:hypothetical protein
MRVVLFDSLVVKNKMDPVPTKNIVATVNAVDIEALHQKDHELEIAETGISRRQILTYIAVFLVFGSILVGSAAYYYYVGVGIWGG